METNDDKEEEEEEDEYDDDDEDEDLVVDEKSSKDEIARRLNSDGLGTCVRSTRFSVSSFGTKTRIASSRCSTCSRAAAFDPTFRRSTL